MECNFTVVGSEVSNKKQKLMKLCQPDWRREAEVRVLLSEAKM